VKPTWGLSLFYVTSRRPDREPTTLTEQTGKNPKSEIVRSSSKAERARGGESERGHAFIIYKATLAHHWHLQFNPG